MFIDAITNGINLVYTALSRFVERLMSAPNMGGFNALLPVFGIFIGMLLVSFAVGIIKRICSN